MLNRRIRTVTIAALAGVLALSACGGSDTKAKPTALDQTTVSGGSDKEAPKVQIKPTPLKVTETQTRVVTAGEGAAVKGDEIVSLRYVLLNGKDGSQLDTNYGKANLGLNLADAKLLPGLKKGLTNQKVGSRILVAMPPKDAFGEQGNANIKVGGGDTVVFLMDVVSVTKPLKSAEGKAVNPPENLPSVKVEEGKPATITIPKGQKPPANTVGQVLIEGKGAKVQAGQTIRVSLHRRPVEGRQDLRQQREQLLRATSRPSSARSRSSPPGTPSWSARPWAAGCCSSCRPTTATARPGHPPKISGTDTLVFVVDILAAY